MFLVAPNIFDKSTPPVLLFLLLTIAHVSLSNYSCTRALFSNLLTTFQI